MTDLVSQNIEVILNRKTNMEAVIKIIEENIPEVTILFSENSGLKYFSCFKNCCFVIDYFVNMLTYFHQLTSLNLSNNRIHKLDDLAELVTKVPHLKTLNLSNNEVKCLNLYLEQ